MRPVFIARCTETDLGMFRHVQHVRPNRGHTKGTSMHRPENIGRQRDIFWPVRASLRRVATFKSSLGAARQSVAYISLPSSESRVSNQVIAPKL